LWVEGGGGATEENGKDQQRQHVGKSEKRLKGEGRGQGGILSLKKRGEEMKNQKQKPPNRQGLK